VANESNSPKWCPSWANIQKTRRWLYVFTFDLDVTKYSEWTEEFFREIADKLAELNKDIKKSIEDYFNKERNERH